MKKKGQKSSDTADTTGFREGELQLDQGTIDELNSIYDKLAAGEDSKDIQTKRRLAQALTGVMENNSLSRKVIQHYSKLAARFSSFTFGDELDQLLADNLNIAQSTEGKDSDIISAWKDIHDKLIEYLSKS